MIFFILKKNNLISLYYKTYKKKGKKHEQFERNFRSRREQEVYREW